LPPSSRTLSPFVVPAAVTTQLHPLSLHDALPISAPPPAPSAQHPPHGQSAHGSPLVPQIGSSADGASAGDSTVGSSQADGSPQQDRKSTRLNSSHVSISYAVFCLKKKKQINVNQR